MLYDQGGNRLNFEGRTIIEHICQRRCFSPREYGSLRYPDSAKFLNEMGISADPRAVLRSLVEREGPKRAFLKIAAAETLGVLPERMDDYFRSYPMNDVMLSRIACDQKTSRHAFAARIKADCSKAILREEKDPVIRVKLFPARFAALSGSLTRDVTGVPHGAEAFAMYLPDDDIREILAGVDDFEEDHVFNSFGYVRFYRRQDHFLVTEIQNDLYGRIRQRALREKYKHWAEVLLLAFESFLFDCTSNPKFNELIDLESSIPSKIIFPDKAAISLRWPEVKVPFVLRNGTEEVRETAEGREYYRAAIAPQLAERLYESLPLKLGFTKVTAPEGRPFDFIETNTKDERVLSQTAWEKRIPIFSLEGAMKHLGVIKAWKSALRHVCEMSEDTAETLPEGAVAAFTLQLPKDATAKLEEDLSKAIHGEPEEKATGSLGLQLHESLERIEQNWDELYDKLFPKDDFWNIDERGIALWHPADRNTLAAGISIDAWREHLEPAPVYQLSATAILGVSQEAVNVAAESAKRYGWETILKGLNKDFVPVSRGCLAEIPSNWWDIPSSSQLQPECRPLHIPGQDRHPSLRFSLPDPHGGRVHFAVGMKGGGMRTFNEPQFERRWTKILGAARCPICPGEEHIKDGEATIHIPSHRFWGGLNRPLAEIEFSNMSALHAMLERAFPNEDQKCALPIDVCLYEALPIWEWGAINWHAPLQYFNEATEDLPQGEHEVLAVLRSASPSDVRLSQIINRILTRGEASAQDPDLCLEEIQSALRYLYRINGYDLRAPSDGFRFQGISCNMGWPEIGEYLERVGQLNFDSASCIRQKFWANTLSAMALVHGTGGHLGGGWTGEAGAISGGALTKRNVDSSAVLHDIDADVFLPWAVTRMSSPGWLARQRANLDKLQWYDAAFWKDTMYWVDFLLFGGRVEEHAELKTHELGRFNRVERFGDLEHLLLPPEMPQRKNGQLSVPCAPIFDLLDSDESKECYRRAFGKGREFC